MSALLAVAFAAQVLSYRDADTLVAVVETLRARPQVVAVRVEGCDALELREPGGSEALEAARAWLPPLSRFVLEYDRERWSFDRLRAHVVRTDGEHFHRQPWCGSDRPDGR